MWIFHRRSLTELTAHFLLESLFTNTFGTPSLFLRRSLIDNLSSFVKGMFINKLWRNNDVTLTTLHCVSYSVGSLHLLGSSFGTLENICTKFTHISQKWFYFSVHYTFYLHIILGRRNWLRCRGRFFIAHTVFHCRNSVKNCFPCKISLKFGNWLPSYPKTIFTMVCVYHLQF